MCNITVKKEIVKFDTYFSFLSIIIEGLMSKIAKIFFDSFPKKATMLHKINKFDVFASNFLFVTLFL